MWVSMNEVSSARSSAFPPMRKLSSTNSRTWPRMWSVVIGRASLICCLRVEIAACCRDDPRLTSGQGRLLDLARVGLGKLRDELHVFGGHEALELGQAVPDELPLG